MTLAEIVKANRSKGFSIGLKAPFRKVNGNFSAIIRSEILTFAGNQTRNFVS